MKNLTFAEHLQQTPFNTRLLSATHTPQLSEAHLDHVINIPEVLCYEWLANSLRINIFCDLFPLTGLSTGTHCATEMEPDDKCSGLANTRLCLCKGLMRRKAYETLSVSLWPCCCCKGRSVACFLKQLGGLRYFFVSWRISKQNSSETFSGRKRCCN